MRSKHEISKNKKKQCFGSSHIGFTGVRPHIHKSKPVQPANWSSITLTTDTLPTSSTHHKNHNHKQQLNNFLKKPHQCMSSMHVFHWSIATTWTKVCGCHLLANETSSYITGRLGLLTAVLVKVSIDHSYRTSYWRACCNQTNRHSKRASITALSIWSRLC